MAGSDEIIRLYENGLSIPDVSALTGTPRSTVRCHLVKAGVALRTRAEGVRNAAAKLGSGHRGKTRTFSDEHKQRIADARKACGEAFAVGTSLKPNGYVEITRGPNKGKSEHVAIMEERLGRRLLPDEVVHHIDGNRSNNRPDNLALMTRAGHTRHHRIIERITKWQAQ